MKGKIKSLASSWITTLVLLAIYIVAAATATVIESASGTEAAREIVYHAPWFMLLHLLLVINFVCLTLKLKLYRRDKWGVLLLHWGFVVIIAGAFVTHIFGYEGLMHIREGESSNTIVMGGNTVRELPISVHLNDFKLERYHGSDTPSEYRSEVTITSDSGRKQQDFEIYMNNIARVDGFRIYQTSFDRDERGTVLTVNSDGAGTFITYAGYFMLMAGLFFALTARGSRTRRLAETISRGGAVLLLLLFLPLGADALPKVSREHADKFGHLVVNTPDGRIKPVNTYSSELLRKIHHHDSYKGMNSDQVLISIIASPGEWFNEQLIYLPDKALRKLYASGNKYASYGRFFNAQGKYILGRDVERIYSTPPQERNKADKEILKLDEKVNILYSLFEGEMLPLFPNPHGGEWLSSGDDLSELSGGDSLLVSKVLVWYGDAVNSGDMAEADKVVGIIAKYQAVRTPAATMASANVDAEVFYNKAGIFRWAFRSYLLFGFALLMAVSVVARRGKLLRTSVICSITIIAATFLWHTFGLGLRWYISGRAPWTNTYESMVYVGWVTVLCGLCFARRSPLVTALAALLGGVILFVSNLSWLDPQITPLVPVLKSYWLMIHVSVITASYGLFGISAVCGLISLSAMVGGKRETPQLQAVNELSINVGLALLTAGIFFGAIWANESWGRYWGWDPKETWALITMLFYALTIHSRFIPKLNNTWVFSAMSVVGLLSVLMTYFGVNYLLSGLHSYGNSDGIPVGIVAGTLTVVAVLITAAGIRYYRK